MAAVVFDLDGTLVDSLPTLRAAFDDFVAAECGEVAVEQVRSLQPDPSSYSAATRNGWW